MTLNNPYMILQLNPTIDVHTPLGDGETFFIIDYGLNVNTVWVCRMAGGEIKHFYSDDIRVYDNPMNGKGFDINTDTIKKIPPGARRNMDFLNKKQ